MRKTLLLLLLTSLSLCATKPAFSQNDEKSTLIGNPGSLEFALNICADPAGNKYIAGNSDQKGIVVKQNAANIIQWSKKLSFTSDPNDRTGIGFMDIAGDTVFGCGSIYEGSTNIGRGAFYFKMNAQTGTLYWSKFDAGTQNYFSCMRYANGKFYLVGGSSPVLTNYGGAVMAVSSQTGQVIWQNTGIQGFVSTNGSQIRTSFISATEMVNGKFFITGYASDNTLFIQRPVLIGINDNGTIFLQKSINVTGAVAGTDQYFGVRIEYDQSQNLILELSNIGSFFADPFFLKCDMSGNLLYAKRYGLPGSGNARKILSSINETATHYVLYGLDIATNGSGATKLYAVKVFKNGTLDNCVSISKPNVSYSIPMGYNFQMGNSAFLNGLHYFIGNETALSSLDRDMNQIILDEDLNVVGLGDCSETVEMPFVESNVAVTIPQLPINIVPVLFAFSNGVTIDDQPFTDPCLNVSLNLVQNPGCQASVTANAVGFTAPTFYWSNGTSGTSSTLPVSTSDTVIVRVLDTKCCELVDTIVPSIVPSSFVMNLPADTTICLQTGNSFTIQPTFSGANGPVTYAWSDNSTGSALSVNQSGTYWVDVSDNCATLRDSIVVTVNSLPVIGNTANVEVCEENFPVTLNPTVSVGATVLWDDGTTAVSRTVNGPGVYTLAATNDCGTVNAAISVSQIDLPTVQLIASVDSCIQSGNSIPLIPATSGALAITWSNGSTGSQLAVSTSGNYTVYVSNSCGMDSASCSVTINYFPELDLPAVLDTCFDIGVGFSYTAQGSPGSYQWSSGSQTATEWISQEGMYSVTLTNQCGSITDSMQVRRFTEVGLYFPEDSIKVCEKQLEVSLLHVETNYNLEIFTPDGDPVGTHLNESGWYLVHAFNPCGEKWDSIYVNLQNEQFFYLPNSFTPNHDGHNDRFEFKGENILVREIRIFNRWGEEIFTETGNFTGWDGIYQGEVCPDGIYSVNLTYEDCFGLPTVFKGHVNLIK